MNKENRLSLVTILLLLLAMLGGCMSTTAGSKLAPIGPPKPALSTLPNLEHTIGGYSFDLDGGKMVTSVKMGRLLQDEILTRWKLAGYIKSFEYVKSSSFSGETDYQLTLGGTQKGESNVALQFLSGLTLFLVPYTVNTDFVLEYSLQHVASGCTYEVSAAADYHTTVGVVAIPGALFGSSGDREIWTRLANSLYQQLVDAGAFADPVSCANPGGEMPAS